MRQSKSAPNEVNLLVGGWMGLENMMEPAMGPDLRCWAPEERHMRTALREAAQAADTGEVPVGAVIIHGNTIIGKAHNQVETLRDPTAHAEILAVTQAAAALGDWRLLDTVMYVTKEPCPMCAGAIIQARIPIVVWGVTDPKRGGAVSLFNLFDHPALNHRVTLFAGFLEEEAKRMLQGFFQARRTGTRGREE